MNFKYNVLDINNDFKKEDLIDSKNVTAAIFLLDQKIDALEFLQRIKAIALFFNSLSDTEIKAIKHWVKNTVSTQLAESAIKILDCDKEVVEIMVANNAFILEEMEQKAIIKGIEQGIEQGREQGIEKREIELILTMLRKGLNEQAINELTDIDLEKIKNIKSNYMN